MTSPAFRHLCSWQNLQLAWRGLFEHIVCVEADKGIAEKVPASEWKAICEGMVKSLKAKKHREGFVEAIGKCGTLLAEHFPIQSDDVDELTNELRILD